MITQRTCALFAIALAGAGMAGCSSKDDTPTSGANTIAVTATDTACTVATAQSPTGKVTFKVTNKGSKVNEFYLYGPNDKVFGEKENIAPGLSADVHVDVPAGTYQTACKPGMVGDGIRAAFTVAAGGATAPVDPDLAAAVTTYDTFVKAQSALLLTRTTAFVTAVKAGQIAKAKALYPTARDPWERIEPVAEIFGDLDPKIDAREGDTEPGTPWTGYHRLEKDLWVDGNVSKSGPIADQLLLDVKTVVAKAAQEKLVPLQLANGAKELLDEVATGKITGEEDRYSHTDLWDFDGNLGGSKAAIDALRPALLKRNPELVKQVDAGFARAQAVLGKHRAGTGWKLHNTLTKAELKELSDAINALGEPISKVAAAIR